jgi:hypothetical protein
MDSVKFIQESQVLLERVSAMKDKLKALFLLDKHEKKWNIYNREIWHHENPLVIELQEDLLIRSLDISRSLNKSESERYGNMLSDEILEPGWCRKQEESFQEIMKNPPKKERSLESDWKRQ